MKRAALDERELHDKPLSDTEIGDRFARAIEALGTAPGETKVGNNAIEAARQGLAKLAFCVLYAAEKRDAASDPPSPQAPKPGLFCR